MIRLSGPVQDGGPMIDRIFAVLRPVQWRRTIADERLQNLAICSTLRAFEQAGIFIVPHML
jgi:hypothetical protein